MLLGALGCALLAVLACQRIAASRRSARTLEQAIARTGAASGMGGAAAAQGGAAGSAGSAGSARNASANPEVAASARKRNGLPGLVDSLSNLGVRWLDTSLGRLIVAEEDRRLLDQCGYADARSRGLYFVIRIASALLLAVLGASYAIAHDSKAIPYAAFGLLIGFLLPKFVVGRRAHRRLDSVADELPMLVDLLRLLQGVGLSLDQSLQVLINEFRLVLPVLASEMEIAQRQFVTGRTREQSLQRMATIYENEDLRAVIRLLVQVDKHGGAVQEPLKQFGERLREVRRATLRERIGKLTVRMTGVMVVTLLPALLIVTAGPGVIAVLHSLSQIHR
nr:type II secretion system F family protein [Paraburkholderia sp. Ac-20340]